MKELSLLWLMVFSVALAGCATPAQRFEEHAGRLGFTTSLVKTKRFNHRIYSNGIKPDGTLHVYLDGDGTPWEHHRWVADDPTSRNPLILDLMKLDSKPAIMLGRPCYHGAGPAELCHSRYWTSHRYSEAVLKSLVQALELWLAEQDIRQIVLIGYSGGGVLAALMASRISDVSLIVTVAANLDVSGWNAFHGYPPFDNSLNALDFADDIKNIRQLHYGGGEDTIVPLSLIRKFAAKSGLTKVVEYPDFDHVCCWLDEWRNILTEINSERTSWSKY